MKEIQFGNVIFIPGENSGRYPFCHSIYVNADKRVLIDPASNKERLITIRDDFGVDEVWLSHYHEDHWAFIGLFEDKDIWISSNEAFSLESLENFLDFYGIVDENMRKEWAEILLRDFNFKPRKLQKMFNGNQTIDLGGEKVDIIAAPGHTPGHLGFYFQNSEVLFLADYDLTRFGPWYGDRDSNVDETIESINHLRQIPARVWLTSHGKGVFDSEPKELWDKYLNIIFKREAKLLDFLNEPRTKNDIINAYIVYRKAREPKAFYDYCEWALMNKHLERLIKQSVVQYQDDMYSLL